MSCGIDWFAFTVHFDTSNETNIDPQGFLRYWLDDETIKVTWRSHGARGYKQSGFAGGINVYTHPTRGVHWHIEVTGEACDSIHPGQWRKLMELKLGKTDIRIRRIDFKVDNVPLSVSAIWACVRDDVNIKLMRSNKESIQHIESPWRPDEKGVQLGTSTIYLGSPTSDRRCRIYDLHGFTRVELQCRNDVADNMGWVLLKEEYARWNSLICGLVRDYFDLELVQWIEFMIDCPRVHVKVTSRNLRTYNKVLEWIKKQVSPALCMLGCVDGWERVINEVVESGKDRLSPYASVLDAYM